MNVVTMWFRGVTRPSAMIAELSNKPAPYYGLLLVLIRFVITAFTSVLSLQLLGRMPFTPSNLSFLKIESYYKAEIFFLPLWGIGIWILMGGIAHVGIRLAGKHSNIDNILNIIGMGMIIPMPFLWLWDWASIAINQYQVMNQAISHSIAQVWELSIQALGFRKIIGIRTPIAILLAVAINAIYILLAIVFIR